MRKILILAIPAVLAACSNDPSVTATNASVSDVQNQVAAAGAEVKMNPGRWETEVTIAMTMPAGMPSQAPQTNKVATCVTPEQVKSGSNPFAEQLGKGCKYDKYSMQGGKIDATMTCNIQGMTTKGAVTGEFSADSVQVKSSTEASGAGAGPMSGFKTESTIDAKRVGECRGDEAKAPAPAG